MKITSPASAYILRFVKVKQVIEALFPNGRGDLVGCPFHEDDLPSLQVYPDGSAHCFGCGKHISDIVTLVSEAANIDSKNALSYLYRMFTTFIPDSEVEAYQRCLWEKSEFAQAYLDLERNLPTNVSKQFELGYSLAHNSIVIPIRDRLGVCVGLKERNLDEEKCKYTNTKGSVIRLFPAKRALFERKMILVEGEFDAMVGRAYGLPTYSLTGGAQSWSEIDADLFNGKAVWILYDNDKPGREGAATLARQLRNLAVSVEIIHPLGEEKDLTDWSKSCVEKVSGLVDVLNSFVWLEKKKEESRCPTCGQILAPGARCVAQTGFTKSSKQKSAPGIRQGVSSSSGKRRGARRTSRADRS